MWPVLHTQEVNSTLRLCSVSRGDPALGGGGLHRGTESTEPSARIAGSEAAKHLGACCFLSMQMGKLSPGEKVTKVLGQLVIVFSVSCSKSA